MAGEISNVPAGKMPNTVDQMTDFMKGLGLSEKAIETSKEIVSLLGGRNVSVNTNQRTDGTETGKPTGSTGVPALDNPADLKQIEANLEKLISYLQMDNDERQTQMAKDRIEMQQNTLDAEHDDRMKQIDESIKKMKDSESASKIDVLYRKSLTLKIFYDFIDSLAFQRVDLFHACDL